MGRRIYVVLNGKAGKAGRFGLDNAQKSITEAFKKTDPSVEVDFGITQAPMHAAELARTAAESGKYYAVCAAGGDGTVNEVCNGMVHTDGVMGVLPWGSGNVFSQEMSISGDIEESTALVLNGTPRVVDTGQVGDRYYLWMLGIGIEAKIAYNVNPTIKKYLGVLSYVFAAAKQIFDPGYSLMKITMDDQEMTFFTFNTIVGNATSFDGFLGIKSQYGIKDGFLDVCILQRKTAGGIIKLLWEFIKGRKDYYRFIDKFSAAHCRVKKLHIETVPNAYYHVDGEVLGMTPIEIQIHPGSMKLIFPD